MWHRFLVPVLALAQPVYVLTSLRTFSGGEEFTNWQGTGVEPDVRVPAAGALEKALELLRAHRASAGAAPGA